MKNNPNENKYFNPDKGCDYNGRCLLCHTPIWLSERIATNYIGKKFYKSGTDEVVGVIGKYGNTCFKCYQGLKIFDKVAIEQKEK